MHSRNCKSRGKAPWGKWKEFQARLPTEAELRRKWADNPHLNVGVALGGITGLIGLDIDDEGGEEVLHRLAAGDLPETLEFTSGRGRRLLYGVPEGVTLRPTPKPGGIQIESGELRLLGLGSQTVMPPSRHESGHRYEWKPGHGPGEIEPPIAPSWVIELMRADDLNVNAKATSRHAGKHADGEKIREGSRNTTLTSLAGTMQRRGMSCEAIQAALRVENATLCEPPLEVAEVDGIAKSVGRYKPAKASADGTRYSHYFVEGGRFYRRILGRDGEETGSYPLCNFTAVITEELILDDGSGETEFQFTIGGSLAGGMPLPPARVRSSEFNSLGWILRDWGARAVVKAGPGAKDQLREAIQVLSTDTKRRHVYRHTGWLQIGGAWTYLHAGGGINAKGLTTDVTVELGGKLAGFVLPEPPTGDTLAQTVRASLDLLHLTSARITAPGLGAVYRSVLGPVDASLFYDGPTGAGKSEWTALLQQHFGAGMSRLNLPGTWTSTANAIETQMFLVKDAIFVLDDFKPGGSRSEVDSWHSKADRVFRSLGNSSARQRCWADGRMRADHPPRCLAVSTGEDRPRGESCAARRLDIHIKRYDIDLPSLTPYQQRAAEGMYAQAMAGYLQGLAGCLDTINRPMSAEFHRLRELARQEGHPRTPGIVADLACGWKFFLDFAEDVGAITPAEREEIWQRAWTGLLSVAKEQDAEITAQEPARRFLDLLLSAISSGGAHVAGINGGEPQEPAHWGWKQMGIDSKASGSCIGWVDGEDLYLDPGSAYAAVQRLGEDQGERLPVSQRQLHKRLDEQGLLVSKEKRHLTTRRHILGRERSVLHLRTQDLGMPKKVREVRESQATCEEHVDSANSSPTNPSSARTSGPRKSPDNEQSAEQFQGFFQEKPGQSCDSDTSRTFSGKRCSSRSDRQILEKYGPGALG